MRTRNMMTVGILTALLAFSLHLVAPAYSQTILIDFGNASSYRGVSTPSPDGNGNHWNSVWSSAYYPDLVDIEGNTTTIDFGFSSAGGTDSYNGPAGVVINQPPTPAEIDATDINAAALGNLGVNEAAMDFYTSSTFEIQGLDPMKTYNLTFFGSHKYSTDATTVYSVYTDNTYSTVVDSTSLNIADTPDSPLHNRNTAVTINGLSPQTGNILYVRFIGSNGNSGYLNCMQIEAASEVKVTNPDPGDSATAIALTANLKWNKPIHYSPVKYVLSFRANNADWLDTGNTTVVNPAIDLDLDSDPATTEAAVPVALNFGTTYYWKVTAFEPGDSAPIEHEGSDWSFTTEAGPKGPPKIMAHYMPWYQSEPVSGYWGWHWHMNHFSPPTTIASHYHPLFGPYDSSDPHVLASHALLMKFGGIDGMIADWYGIEDFWDYGLIRDATNDFIPYMKMAQLEFSICYEDQTVKHMLNNAHFANRDEAVAHGVQVMEWLEDNYFTDSSYLKIDNKPVLLCFGPQFFTYSEWERLFENLALPPLFFALPYSDAPKTGEFNWPAPAEGTSGVTSNLNRFYDRADAAGWDQFVGSAFPRFHDIYEQAGIGTSYGYIDDQDTATFTETLERALLSNADIVQIVTWNDYGEGTIVEPTQEDNYTFLEIIQQHRKNYIDPNFPYTASDLRLPTRLYTMRKTYGANPAKMIRLDSVEADLFADRLEQAEMGMNQIDCTTVTMGDFNGDCKLNLFDFERFSYSWLSDPADLNWDPEIDISDPKDDKIDILDLMIFAENWLMINL